MRITEEDMWNLGEQKAGLDPGFAPIQFQIVAVDVEPLAVRREETPAAIIPGAKLAVATTRIAVIRMGQTQGQCVIVVIVNGAAINREQPLFVHGGFPMKILDAAEHA